MRILLSTLLLVFFTNLSFSQTCTPTFTVTHSPSNNDLLRSIVIVNNAPSIYNIHTVVDWGDGTVMPSASWGQFHSYSTPGTYTVKVIKTLIDSSTNIIYCVDSATNNITLAYDSCMTTVSAVVDPMNNGKITYTASTPLTGTPLYYQWNFNDGTPNVFTASHMPNYNTVTHTYANTSNHRVTLTAYRSFCSYTNNRFDFVINGCGVTNINPPSITGGFVQFNSNSTNIPNSTQSHAWDFGDGTTGTGKSPSHVYAAGTFNARLITSWYDNQNQLICKDTATRSITAYGSYLRGILIKDSTQLPINPSYKVWLIKYDSSSKTLSAVDSQTVHNTQNYSSTYYEFSMVHPGTYRIKAAIINGPSTGNGFVPTYHDSDLLWSNAKTVNYTGATVYKFIYMQQGALTSGPGFVAGNVTQGANKGTSGGIQGMDVYLLDNNNNLIQSAITDASGSFSFSQVPNGTYKVHPEQMNYTTTDASITITNGQASFNGINFERSHSQKTIAPKTLNIANVAAKSINFSIYPNPTNGVVTIEIKAAQRNDNATILVTDVTGKNILTTITNKDNTQLDLSHLQKGLYFITIKANNSQQTQKLLIQ